jgi:hypothetical protein
MRLLAHLTTKIMSDYSAMELLFSAIEKPISQLTLCDFLPKKITRNQLLVTEWINPI